MRRFVRFSMLFVGFLALQLNALAGGVACLLASSANHTGIVAASMAEMGMAAPQELHARSASAKLVDSPRSSQSPCQQSSTPPRSSCQSMTPCATAFTAAVAYGATVPILTPSGALPLTELAPVSRSLSPELPPPRA